VLVQPFVETVNRRFSEWLAQQAKLGRKFTPGQTEWLNMIKDHIATSLSIDIADFELAPFYEKGGPVKAQQIFGEELRNVIEELNSVLAA
jgi:type I restriction enzyme R subunit